MARNGLGQQGDRGDGRANTNKPAEDTGKLAELKSESSAAAGGVHRTSHQPKYGHTNIDVDSYLLPLGRSHHVIEREIPLSLHRVMLCQIMDHPRAATARAFAAGEIVRQNYVEGISDLLEALRIGPYHSGVVSAIAHFGKHSAAAVPTLAYILEHGDPSQRCDAIRALCKIGTLDAAKVILAHLKSLDKSLNSAESRQEINLIMSEVSNFSKFAPLFAPYLLQKYQELKPTDDKQLKGIYNLGLAYMLVSTESGNFNENSPWRGKRVIGNSIVLNRDAVEISSNKDDSSKMNTAFPWDPETGDVFLRVSQPTSRVLSFLSGEKTPRSIETNVAWSFAQSSESGFAFGYRDGLDEFAINVLNQFVPPGSDGMLPVSTTSLNAGHHFTGSCSLTAFELARKFEDEMLKSFSYSDSVQISGRSIRDWIAKNQPEILRRNRHLQITAAL